jgi:sugar phosphate isomerase/epimerase
MSNLAPVYIAVSSWALHRTLGVSYPDSPEAGPSDSIRHSDGSLDILDLPKALRDAQFSAAELCHFHLPATDLGKIDELRHRFAEVGVKTLSLLIDAGDPSDPTHSERDATWMQGWVDVASRLGAERARVVAGKQPFSEEAFSQAATIVKRLAVYAKERGVRLTTENWFPLLSTPEAVHRMLDLCEGDLGLCADFGNWESPRKYEDLPKILPRAETCHAKCDFLDASTIDMDDYGRCLKQAKEAGFDGPLVLVNGGPEDEWKALAKTRAEIQTIYPA